MTHLRWALACVLVAVPIAGSAQDLTVDEMVALALERSPVILAARTDLQTARGQLVGAALRPNPMAGASRQEMFDGPDTQTMVEVQWPLDLFRRPARVASARHEIERTSLSIADRERLLTASVREQAGRVLEARRTLRVLEELLSTDRELRDVMEARVREGAVPRLDLDILQVELQRTEAQVALQSAEAEAALIELTALVGLEPGRSPSLRGDLEDAVRSAPSLAPEAGSALIDNRADVREAAARVGLAESLLEEARREGWVDASVVAEYARMSTGFPQRAFGEAGALVPIHGVFNNLRVGLMVSVPVWDRNQGAIASAIANRQRVEHEVAANRLSARAELAVAEARDRAARRAVEFSSSARDQARANLAVVREAYQLGSGTVVDVLAEQRRYLDVETAYTQALAEVYRAHVALRRARGN